MWSCVIEPKFKINLVCHATFTAMRSEIQQAVQLLLRGDDAVLEQALALLQNTVFSFY
jgi:exonuclease VII small subunit